MLAGMTVPQLLSIEQAANRLGIRHTTLFKLLGSGELRSVKIRGRRLISEDALREYVAKLEASA
jgi:excisionase family DNA binding protein